METPEKTNVLNSSLAPIRTSALESPRSPQNVAIHNRVNEIGNILENNHRRWIVLQQQDQQLVNSLLRLTEQPNENDPEKFNEFYGRLETQSAKISSLLSEYESVLATHSKCLADFEGLRKLSELSKGFRWKSWTLEQLYRRNADLLDDMKEEYEIKAISYRSIPHCYEKPELEFHRTMLKYPDKSINLKMLATRALESGKSKLDDSVHNLSPK